MKKEPARKLPFRVPENYFEELPARLAERLEPARPKRFALKRWLSAAAVLAGIALLAQITLAAYGRYLERNNAEYELFLLSQMDAEAYYDYLFDQ